MIIINQDRTAIYNTDNIENIRLGNLLEEYEGKFPIVITTISDNEYIIAKYKTEEKAIKTLREVLNAMVGKSKFSMTTEGYTAEVTDAYYKMPEE